MKPNTISKALIVAMAALMFAGCNTKHTQEETNATHMQNPTTQTTQETNNRNDTTGKGVPSVQTDDGTTSSNASSGNSAQGSTNTTTGSSNIQDSDGATATEEHIDAGTTDNDAHTTTGADNHNNTSSDTDDHGTNGNNNAGTDNSGTDTTNTEDNATTGNSDNNTTNGNDANTTTPNTPALTKLTLESNTTTLNVGENARLKLIAAYQDNTTKPINKDITYIITPKDHADINGTLLSAHKDGNLTVQAKVGNMLSNTITLDIYWEVDGHRLPPEPDPKVNNATLLGIDSNHNGVRDDVERWIYQHYDHPIERGIMLQNSYRLQKQISDISKAHKYAKLTNKSLSCEYYLENTFKWFKDKYEYSITSKEIKKIQFNTIQRHIAYQKYNASFNGEVFSEKIVPNINNCQFDNNGNLREEQ